MDNLKINKRKSFIGVSCITAIAIGCGVGIAIDDVALVIGIAIAMWVAICASQKKKQNSAKNKLD